MIEANEEVLVPDQHPVYDRVAKVANRILRSNKDLEAMHGKEWTITVVRDDTRNAFVLPVINHLYSLR